MNRSLFLVLLAGLTLLQACATAPRATQDYGLQDTQASVGVAAWMDGAGLQQLQWEGKVRNAFFVGEMLYHDGDVEGAFNAYAEVLRADVNDPAARYAAARLYTIRDSVVSFPARIMPIVEELNLTQVEPLTRLYVTLIHQAAAFRLWDLSMDYAPFDHASVNFAGRWNVTPMLSPWRAFDWETELLPEQEQKLGSSYLSPLIAKDEPANYEPTTPFFPAGLNLAPSWKQNGISYLETFVEVDRPMGAWVYANFAGAGRVWIDGVEVLENRDLDYESGKFFSRVELSPGVHRILVKLGVQRGYRDWFELQILPDQARLGEVSLKYTNGCLDGRLIDGCFRGDANGSIELVDDVFRAVDLEPVWVAPEFVEGASDIMLYLTLLGAHFSGDVFAFDVAMARLLEMRPKFAAAHALRSLQIQTRWELPSRLRDATALQSLREAHELDPTSGLYVHLLASRLVEKSRDREVRELHQAAYERAKDEERLRYLSPISAWAGFLEAQGYEESSEQIWREALETSPDDCAAARKVQTLEQSRQIFREPGQITDFHESCPALHEAYVNARTDMAEENLRMVEKYASRFPYREDSQRRFADELVKMGKIPQARAVIDMALKRSPDSASLWNWKIDRIYVEQGLEAAVKAIDTYIETHGTYGWLIWKRATLTGEMPLLDLMPDGYAAAMKAVDDSATASLSKDDAYYVVDYAARRYMPDGASVTLTHTVVRVMTKNAIDRYAETNVPGDAQVIQVRTIKQSGETLIPDDNSGKETLSMPGLAEGDFVEVAYVQYSPGPSPQTQREGVKFYFKMKDISTLHSEYTVWGDAGEVLSQNDAPVLEKVSHMGMSGMRFLAVNNPRPRQEPYTVPVDEFLPWIQTYRHALTISDFEAARRARFDLIVDSLRVSDTVRAQFDAWIEEEGESLETVEGVRSLFYKVSNWIPDPNSNQFATEATHAFLTREGSAHLLLKALLDYAEIPAEIYMVRSALASPIPTPLNEMLQYSIPVIRIEVADEVRWASPDGPDASWNALGPMVQGQAAICVTCTEPKTETIPDGDPLKSYVQRISVDGDLDAQGTLVGTISIDLPGTSALSFRQGLRARKDADNREKLMGSLAANIIAGSSVLGYEILNEEDPEQDLAIRINFERPGFARQTAGGRLVETRIFHEAIAQYYGSLSARTTPMVIGYNRFATQSFTLRFPSTPQLLSSGLQARSEFGDYVRRVSQSGNTIQIVSDIKMSAQRVSPEKYPEFQSWASRMEESSMLKVVY